MYYLILNTPPDTYNSEYTAHLIEHLKLTGAIEQDNYFKVQKYDGTSYSYYSTYTIDTEDSEIVNTFIDHLILPIKPQNLTREMRRIREELEEREYSKKVVESMGKIIFGSTHKYARSTQASLAEIQAYHTQYYHKDAISIFTKNYISTRDIVLPKLDSIEITRFRIGNEYSICLYTSFSPLSIFLFFLLEKLFDSYLDYLDIKSGKYWTRYTVQGEHPGKIWISYKRSDSDDLGYIPDDFLDSFIEYILKEIQNNSKNEIPEYDLVSLFQYGYILSMRAKSEIIQNLRNYYREIQSHINHTSDNKNH